MQHMHTEKECTWKICENNSASTVQCKMTTCNMSFRLLQWCRWALSSSGMCLCIPGQLDPPFWGVQFFQDMPLCHWVTESWHFEAIQCTDLQGSKCPDVFLGLSEHWRWGNCNAPKKIYYVTQGHIDIKGILINIQNRGKVLNVSIKCWKKKIKLWIFLRYSMVYIMKENKQPQNCSSSSVTWHGAQ